MKVGTPEHDRIIFKDNSDVADILDENALWSLIDQPIHHIVLFEGPEPKSIGMEIWYHDRT